MKILTQNFQTKHNTAPFSQIKLDNYKPAFEETIAKAKAEIDTIITNSETPTFENTIDLIVEQTFFCALEPALRKKYVQKTHTLLKEKGKLIGLLFQFPLTTKGPPFGGSKTEYENLFKNDFSIKILETAHNSIKPRQNNELFFIFEKK